MFNSSILQIQEELHYHQQQQEKLEQELYTLKSYEEFSSQAFDYVKETIEQIQDPKYLELFKEGLLSLFPIFPNKPIYLEESVETNDYVEKINSYPIPATSGEAEAATLRVGDGIFPAKQVEEKKKKSYFELTGKPDLRPTTYEDLSVNISYSSSGRAYIGFNDLQEAESFRERLTVPSMLDKGEVMYMYEWEVKFYCDREYLNQLVTKDTVNNFEKISPRVIYNHNDRIVYLGMTAKGRCDCYGQYLTDQLTVGEKYTVSNKPSIIKGEEYKYELRITEVSLDDAIHLANFNLQRDPDHPDNAKLLTDWRASKVREVPPAYTPSPKPTPLNEIKIGEIVSRGPHNKQYKVLGIQELQGTLHAEVICTYNSEMPALVNQKSYLKEVYRVLVDDIQYDDNFQEEELDFRRW